MARVSFKKLFKVSLLPASFLIFAKLFAFWLIVMSMNVPWTLNYDSSSMSGIYPVVSSFSIRKFVSFMDLLFISIVLCGLVYYLIAALFLHNTHIHPRLISRLAKYNLLFLIKNNFNLYHELIVWILFAWIANGLVLINSIKGLTFIGIPTFSILFTAFLTVVFIKDAVKELDKNK